jgi:hypothetical protein
MQNLGRRHIDQCSARSVAREDRKRLRGRIRLQGNGSAADASISQVGRSECCAPRRFIAVSFHRLFLGRLLPSRACFRFTGCVVC